MTPDGFQDWLMLSLELTEEEQSILIDRCNYHCYSIHFHLLQLCIRTNKRKTNEIAEKFIQRRSWMFSEEHWRIGVQAIVAIVDLNNQKLNQLLANVLTGNSKSKKLSKHVYWASIWLELKKKYNDTLQKLQPLFLKELEGNWEGETVLPLDISLILFQMAVQAENEPIITKLRESIFSSSSLWCWADTEEFFGALDVILASGKEMEDKIAEKIFLVSPPEQKFTPIPSRKIQRTLSNDKLCEFWSKLVQRVSTRKNFGETIVKVFEYQYLDSNRHKGLHLEVYKGIAHICGMIPVQTKIIKALESKYLQKWDRFHDKIHPREMAMNFIDPLAQLPVLHRSASVIELCLEPLFRVSREDSHTKDKIIWKALMRVCSPLLACHLIDRFAGCGATTRENFYPEMLKSMARVTCSLPLNAPEYIKFISNCDTISNEAFSAVLHEFFAKRYKCGSDYDPYISSLSSIVIEKLKKSEPDLNELLGICQNLILLLLFHVELSKLILQALEDLPKSKKKRMVLDILCTKRISDAAMKEETKHLLKLFELLVDHLKEFPYETRAYTFLQIPEYNTVTKFLHSEENSFDFTSYQLDRIKKARDLCITWNQILGKYAEAVACGGASKTSITITKKIAIPVTERTNKRLDFLNSVILACTTPDHPRPISPPEPKKQKTDPELQ